MNIKLFATVVALGGGCVGVPLYLFLQTGKPSGAVSWPSLSSNVSVTKVTQSDTNMEQKSIARGECTVIDLPQEIQSFWEINIQVKEIMWRLLAQTQMCGMIIRLYLQIELVDSRDLCFLRVLLPQKIVSLK